MTAKYCCNITITLSTAKHADCCHMTLLHTAVGDARYYTESSCIVNSSCICSSFRGWCCTRLTAVLVLTVVLAQVVPHEVAESVALPPEGVEVGQHPGQEAVRGPRSGVELGGHPGGCGSQPAHGSLRGDACPKTSGRCRKKWLRIYKLAPSACVRACAWVRARARRYLLYVMYKCVTVVVFLT